MWSAAKVSVDAGPRSGRLGVEGKRKRSYLEMPFAMQKQQQLRFVSSFFLRYATVSQFPQISSPDFLCGKTRVNPFFFSCSVVAVTYSLGNIFFVFSWQFLLLEDNGERRAPKTTRIDFDKCKRRCNDLSFVAKKFLPTELLEWLLSSLLGKFALD